jgi:hypothetical protein
LLIVILRFPNQGNFSSTLSRDEMCAKHSVQWKLAIL